MRRPVSPSWFLLVLSLVATSACTSVQDHCDRNGDGGHAPSDVRSSDAGVDAGASPDTPAVDVPVVTDLNASEVSVDVPTVPTDDGVADVPSRDVPGCPDGSTLCAAACVNTATDSANCGSCGHACETGTSCAAGTCMGGVRGEMTFLTSGPFVVPAGVNSISVVVVGGGGAAAATGGAGGGAGLCYANDIPVSPGLIVPITVSRGGGDSSYGGIVTARGGDSSRGGDSRGGSGGVGTVTGVVGRCFAGGTGGDVFTSGAGGGGAAGYAGSGGHGGSGSSGTCRNDATGGSGGGGGGGGGSSSMTHCTRAYGGGGGGVGLFGIGADGVAGVDLCNPCELAGGGGGGSRGGTGGGGVADAGTTSGYGGPYGGGAGSGTASTAGGPGAVRIIWGPGRSFPNNAM